jgi:transcriptional regulator of acetoin/glycerol metabolism
VRAEFEAHTSVAMLTLRSPSVGYWERNAPRLDGLVGGGSAGLGDLASDPVIRCWQRSASLGVRADGDAPPDGVDGHALVSLRAELDEVCTLGGRLLDPLARELSDRNLVALLTDGRGTILLTRGGGMFSKTAARARLVEGAKWGEPVRGTNAIGTAIVERCPVAVVGHAHYERVNHGLFCYAVPIWGTDGDVIAVIDVTGKLEDEDPFAELAVTSFAYRLEHALRHQSSARRLSARKSSLAPDAREATRAGPPEPSRGAVDADPFANILGTDAAVTQSKSLARRVARSDLPVMLLAETGTGKELMARAVHAASDRSAKPFVPINCGAIAPTLLESELFGYASGAFTGARTGGHIGKVGAASGGTLFLDEIAEMPPPLQAALLRLLDDGAYYRVGDNEPRHADIRLVCATCRDLPAMVRAGAFRSDLYFRVKGATISLPPLRLRTDRIPLAYGILQSLAADRHLDRSILSAASEALIHQAPWPGNVRELKTALHHALVLADGAVVLEPWHFPADLLAGAPLLEDPKAGITTSRTVAERGAVEQALRLAAGNLSEAARRLGVARSTLYRLARRHGLSTAPRE